MALMTFKKWALNVLIAVDQLVNAIFSGSPDETISSRCYRGAVLAENPKLKWRVMHKVINGLFFDNNHCETSYQSEVHRRQYPPEFQSME